MGGVYREGSVSFIEITTEYIQNKATVYYHEV